MWRRGAWTDPCGGDYFQLKLGELLARDHNLPEEIGGSPALLLGDPGDISWQRAGEDTSFASAQSSGHRGRQQPWMLGTPQKASPVKASKSPTW